MKVAKDEPKKKAKSKLPKTRKKVANKKVVEEEIKELTQDEINAADRIKYKDHVFFGFRINDKYKFLSFSSHKQDGYCLRNDLTNLVVMGCTTHSDYKDVLKALKTGTFKDCKPMPVTDFI